MAPFAISKVNLRSDIYKGNEWGSFEAFTFGKQLAMSNLALLIITALTTFALHLNSSAGQLQEDFWQSFAPGELLRLLESATFNLPFPDEGIAQRRSDVTPQPIAELPVTLGDSSVATTDTVRKRIDLSGDESAQTEDQVHASSSDEINYDQAYEEFVRKYFSDKLAEDNDSDEYNTDDAGGVGHQDDEHKESDELKLDTDTEHNLSLETEQQTEETKTRATKKSKEKCRRVRKHKQNCLICENPKSGEKSESCSFSRQSEPQNYAFEREKSYKKQRDVDEPTSQSVEQTSAEESSATDTDDDVSFEVFNKRDSARRRSAGKPPKDSSTCIQMVKRNKICYQCVDGDGTTTNCYTTKKGNTGSLNKTHPAKPKEHKVQKNQQRIYKRTISYSFEKGTNGTTANQTPSDTTGQMADVMIAAVSNGSPHLKEKIVFKVVKQNETIAE